MKNCPSCDREILDDASRCRYCGALRSATPRPDTLPVGASMSAYPPSAVHMLKQSSALVLGLIIACVAVVVAVGTVGYAMHRRGGRRQVGATKFRVARVLDAVLQWKREQAGQTGRASACPSSLEQLVGRRLSSAVLQDDRGRRLKVSCEDGRVCVWSVGPNGIDDDGAGDDVLACESGATRGR